MLADAAAVPVKIAVNRSNCSNESTLQRIVFNEDRHALSGMK
jgi:hypothetical protein